MSKVAGYSPEGACEVRRRLGEAIGTDGCCVYSPEARDRLFSPSCMQQCLKRCTACGEINILLCLRARRAVLMRTTVNSGITLNSGQTLRNQPVRY